MRILLIEDDIDLCNAVSFQLRNNGYVVDHCYDGAEGFYLIRQQAYDLIVLDRMLPSLDGISILKAIRNLNIPIPIIMVTALNSIGDRVIGLDAGADDYLVKPFATEELLARIRALSRRPIDWDTTNKIELGDVILDTTSLTLTGPLSTCTLSKKELALFEAFF